MVLTLFALGGAQCALTAVIALKTQKNEKKISKKVQEGWESKGSDQACGLTFEVSQFCFGDFVWIACFPP